MIIVATQHDLAAYLADPSTHDAAVDHLQCLLDEQYGYDAAGVWGLVGGGGLDRLGLTRSDAVAMGAVDRMVLEPAGPDIIQVKEAACARLNAKRDAMQYSIYTDSQGHPYDTDACSREKMTGLEAKIANGLMLPDGFAWTGADNVERAHTNTTFLALTTEIMLWTTDIHSVCVAAKAAIRADAVTTPGQVSAIEGGVVWP